MARWKRILSAPICIIFATTRHSDKLEKQTGSQKWLDGAEVDTDDLGSCNDGQRWAVSMAAAAF